MVTAVSQLPGAARAGSGVARQPVPVCVVTVSVPVRSAEKIRSPLAVAASAMAPGLAAGAPGSVRVSQPPSCPADSARCPAVSVKNTAGSPLAVVAATIALPAAGWPGSGCVTQPEPAR